jgi:AcrR family transcriptional regulator
MTDQRTVLTGTRIVAVARSLIDANGLAKFSMRKLGAELGVDPMAVYRHFIDQEALFDGIAEALFAELDVDSLPWRGSWRPLCAEYCRRMRDTLLAHPHSVTIFATRPVRSTEAIEAGNAMIALLQRDGFPPSRALQVVRCLREFTVGHALTLAVVELGGQRRSRKPGLDSSEYNLLARAADGAGIGEHFDTGLAAMLDGFAGLAGP